MEERRHHQEGQNLLLKSRKRYFVKAPTNEKTKEKLLTLQNLEILDESLQTHKRKPAVAITKKIINKR